jgi:hypothetical protein
MRKRVGRLCWGCYKTRWPAPRRAEISGGWRKSVAGAIDASAEQAFLVDQVLLPV